MSAYDRHHYIPRFVLDRFADTRGLLYVHDNRDPQSKIREQSPRDTFVQKHLYSRKEPGGARDRTLEKQFAILEGRASDIIRRIVEQARARCVAPLSSEERVILDFFVWMQWRRVPELHEELITEEAIEQEILDSVQEFERTVRPMTESEREWIAKPELRRDFRQNVIVGTLSRSSDVVPSALDRRGIMVVTPGRPTKSFVVGSRPVIRMGPPRSTLDQPETELWMVLAPDVAMTYLGLRGEDRFAQLDAKGCRLLNERMSRNGHILVSRSRELICSLRAAAGSKRPRQDDAPATSSVSDVTDH